MTELGQTTEVVPEGESALDVMQKIDHLNDSELGILIEDTINGEQRLLQPGPGSCWIEYRHHPDCDTNSAVHAHFTDDVSEYIELNRGKIAVVPVETMPFFGDGSLNSNRIFNS
jgi:hypothetical protein